VSDGDRTPTLGLCGSLDVQCPPEAHARKALPSGWHCWEVGEPLAGRA
jgi:hypothetical protein